jgi:fibrillarin-like pre-rRNA processing protein
MELKQKFPGVYLIRDHLATKNLTPSIKVYGEKLVEEEGLEYRIWDSRRSKLAAAILNGLKTFPIKEDSKVLYLGASAGTTPSHISDITINGVVYCVEFSPRMMRHLAEVCQTRSNMIPLLDDATKPQNYLQMLQKVDVVYSDVAQPRQSELFMANLRFFLKQTGVGIIMVKSRSIDVTQSPKKVFRQEESKLKSGGFQVVEKIDLAPYEKDHMAFVCKIAF